LKLVLLCAEAGSHGHSQTHSLQFFAVPNLT